tara:strand:- start:566 stop:2254 length:1689 start_codon:yes stop_codon:yes gene_type:complete
MKDYFKNLTMDSSYTSVPPENTAFDNQGDRWMAFTAKVLFDVSKGVPVLSPDDFIDFANQSIEKNRKINKELTAKYDGNKKVYRDLKKAQQEANKAHKTLVEHLNKLKALPTPEDTESAMQELWGNYVVPQAKLYRKDDAKHVGQVDLERASSVVLSTSEQSVKKLERALERGKFEVGNMSENPVADISGRVGQEEVGVTAELMPAGSEQLQLILDMADRLKDPTLNTGPKTQQVFEALMSFWLTRKDRRGAVTLGIGEIAAAIGYTPDKGGHQKKNIETVRDAVNTLSRINLQVLTPKIQGQELNRAQMSEAALTFTYLADSEEVPAGERAEKHWTGIRVRPNTYLEIVLDRQGALLMGADRKINKLNAVKERSEVLLGKYLETQWRINWNKQPGVITRKVSNLLEQGIGESLESIARKRKVLDKLDTALEKLQEIGIIKHFEYEARFVDLDDGSRLVDSKFNQLLECTVNIEAGSDYHEHYKNFGISQKKGELLPVLQDLKKLLSSTKQSQASVAQELGIPVRTVGSWLSGNRKLTDQNKIKKLQEYVANELSRESDLFK